MSRGASGEPESEGVPDCDRGAGRPLRRMGTCRVRSGPSSGKSEGVTDQELHAGGGLPDVPTNPLRVDPMLVQAGVEVVG